MLMANNLKISPQGIDRVIQQAQVELYNELSTLWEISLDGYGRVYKVEKGKKIIPTTFKDGSNKDYDGNLLTRKNKFFFSKVGDSEPMEDSEKWFTSNVNIYFILDVSEINPTITHRSDQEVQIDVIKILGYTKFELTKIVDTNLSSVLSEFSGLYDVSKFDDMHPYHIFKCECTVDYELTKTTC